MNRMDVMGCQVYDRETKTHLGTAATTKEGRIVAYRIGMASYHDPKDVTLSPPEIGEWVKVRQGLAVMKTEKTAYAVAMLHGFWYLIQYNLNTGEAVYKERVKSLRQGMEKGAEYAKKH